MTAITVLALVLSASDGLPVQVQGTSRCPTSTDVAAILPEMLPVTNDPHPDIVWIEAAGLDLSIELRSAEGKALSSRRITARGTCADLASAAAVVIASWKIEQNPELSLLQPGVHPQGQADVKPPPSVLVPAAEVRAPPPIPAARRSPLRYDLAAAIGTAANSAEFAGTARLEAGAHGQRTPSVLVPAAEVRAPPPIPTARRNPLRYDLAAAIGTAANSAGFAGTARLEAGARGQRFGLRIAFAGDTERDQSIEARTATWRRLAVGAGPSLTLVDGIVALEMHAQLVAGITTVHGQNFDSNRQTSDVSPGFASVLRLGRASGWVRPFIECGGQFWFAPQEIAVLKGNQPATRVPLPRIEARVALGISFQLSK